jgi:hypothetical protein
LGSNFLTPCFEHLEQLAFGQFDALEQRLQRRVRGLAQLGIKRAQCTLHVVGDRQHVASKRRDAVLAHVGNLALGPFAQVLHLGQRPQQPVLVLGILTRERLDQFGDLRLLGHRSSGLGLPGALSLRLGGRVVRAAGGIIRHCTNPLAFPKFRPGYQGFRAKNQACGFVTLRWPLSLPVNPA